MGAGTAARNIGIWAYGQAQDAIGKGQGILDTAQGNALSALGRGFDQARTDLGTQYTGAIDRLNPWVTAGQGALNTYQGSLGLGGQAGHDAAVSAFREAPGYRYSVDQATDAVARKASALGALGSGNTMQAVSDRAQNMADQGYQNWQSQLSGLSDRGQQAATTQAGLQGQYGSTLAGLGTQQGNAEAGLYGTYAGLGMNNLWNGTTAGINAVQNAQTQAANAVASRNSLTANVIGSGLGLLGMPMGGGMTMGGSIIGGLRNLGTGGLNYY